MKQSFWDHAYELRSALIKSVALFSVAFLLSLSFYDRIVPLLLPQPQTSFKVSTAKLILFENKKKSDLRYNLKIGERLVESEKTSWTEEGDLLVKPGGFLKIEQVKPETTLFLLSPLEGLLTSLRLSLWIGAGLSSPFWLYWALQFVFPALKRRERGVVFPLLLSTLLSAFLAATITFFGILPHIQELLGSSFDSVATPLWSLTSYIDLLLFLLFASFTVFELGFLALLTIHFGLISPYSMSKSRKVCWLAAFILGALLTPPDIFSQLLVAFSLILFYELAVFYGFLRERLRGASDIDKIVATTLI